MVATASSFTYDPRESAEAVYEIDMGDNLMSRAQIVGSDGPESVSVYLRHWIVAKGTLAIKSVMPNTSNMTYTFFYLNRWWMTEEGLEDAGVSRDSNTYSGTAQQIWLNGSRINFEAGDAIPKGDNSHWEQAYLEKTHELRTVPIKYYHELGGYVAQGDADVATSSLAFKKSMWTDAFGTHNPNIIEVVVPPKDSYEVTFDANGGDQAQCPEAMTKWHGEELAIPECVMGSALGKFMGWSTSPTGSAQFKSGTIPAAWNLPLTLYAVWDPGRYDLLLDPCGGAGDTVDLADCETGIAFTLGPCPYTRPGYDFRGWSTTAGGEPEYPDGGVFCMEAQSYRPSVTLYACWRRDKPKITSLACDRSGSGSAAVAVDFSLYHAQDFDLEDAPTATVTVTASPRGAGSEGADVVQVFPGLSEPEALLEMEGLESDLAYGIQVDVSDDIDPSLSDTRYSIVGTGEYTLDFAPGGKGMGVFMKCPKGKDGRGQGVHVSAEDGFSIYGLEGYGDKTLQDLLEEVKREAKREAALAAHPVGSYYWSDDPKSPEEIFGGEWDAVEDCFVYAAGTKAATHEIDGEETHLLKSSESGVPDHSHPIKEQSTENASADHTHGMQNHTHTSVDRICGISDSTNFLRTSGTYTVSSSASNKSPTTAHHFLYNDSSGTVTSGTKATGGPSNNTTTGQSQTHSHKVAAHDTEKNASADATSAHNNMPPYIVAYCWRRVA